MASLTPAIHLFRSDPSAVLQAGGGRGTTAIKFQKEGDSIVGKELWRNPDQSVQFNTPVVKEGLLYGLSQSNDLFCIDEQTGKAVWTKSIAPPDGGGPGGGFRRGGPDGSVQNQTNPRRGLNR